MASAKTGKLHNPDLTLEASDQIWFRWSQSIYGTVSFKLYSASGSLVTTQSIGADTPPGGYTTRGRAYFWNKTEDDGITGVAAGEYFLDFLVDSVVQDRIRIQIT